MWLVTKGSVTKGLLLVMVQGQLGLGAKCQEGAYRSGRAGRLELQPARGAAEIVPA